MATTTKKPTTDPQRRAAIRMLRLGHASLSEVAELAGVPRQNVHMWTKLDGMTDWQSRRKAWLERQWAKRTKGDDPAIRTYDLTAEQTNQDVVIFDPKRTKPSS